MSAKQESRPRQKAQQRVPRLPPPPLGAGRAEIGEPGGGQGRVDITGTMPDDVRIDTDITEGHPGYEDSGSSAIG